MLGLSPPTALPGAPLPDAPGAEPTSLEKSASAEAPQPIPGIPVASVTRAGEPAGPRPGSEPEIGSVDLALESVVKAGDMASKPPPPPEAEAAEPEGAVPLDPDPAATALSQGNDSAAASNPPEPAPRTLPFDQTLPLAQPLDLESALPANAPVQAAPAVDPPSSAAAPVHAAVHPAPSAIAAARADSALGAPATQPSAKATPRSPASAPSKAPKKGSAALLWLGSLFGVVLLSGGALGFVLWKMPDSNIARALRDVAAKIRPPVVHAPPPAAAETARAEQSAEPPAAPSVPPAESAAPDEAPGASNTSVAPEASATDDSPSAAVTVAEQAASAEADAPPATSDDSTAAVVHEIPPGVNQSRLIYLTRLAVRHAEQCHLGGRAVGTAKAFLTFQPDGRVSDARLEGEPVASAPVAKCVLNNLRAVVIKPYDGPPFTHTTQITLR
jgi:hypothetical protein